MNYIWLIIAVIIGYIATNYIILINKINRTKFYVDSMNDIPKDSDKFRD